MPSTDEWLPGVGMTLPELLRSGDPDAFAGFRDAHLGAVRAYAAAVCPDDRTADACDAAFIDFIGRLRSGPSPDEDLESLLLKATRSACSGRFIVVPTAGSTRRRSGSEIAICNAVPELLAAERNGESRHDARLVRVHTQRCPTCATTSERIARAERAYEERRGPTPEKYGANKNTSARGPSRWAVS